VKEFFVAEDGRPHPPWRILLFLLLVVACVVVTTLTLRPFFEPLHQITGIGGTGAAYTATIALLLAHWMTFESYDKRPWSFVGLGRENAKPRTLLAGAALGAAPITLASLILLGVGFMAVRDSASGSLVASALKVLIILLPAAMYEELLMRGYAFATLREWLGAPAAVALTSIAFGLLHAANPGTTYTPLVVVTLAGVYLAVVLIATQSLFAAWTAHAAWNFVQAGLLHVPVSGLPMARPNYELVETGPDWLTGGEWGPEGGVMAAAAILAACAFLYWRHNRHKPTNG
jgi:membrane protease YdiL (CAAX protease family)